MLNSIFGPIGFAATWVELILILLLADVTYSTNRRVQNVINSIQVDINSIGQKNAKS